MTGNDLTKAQLAKVSEHIRGMLGYLYRLKARMEATGFPLEDDLYRLVANAEDAVHRLSIDVHYRSCEGGVFREPRTK